MLCRSNHTTYRNDVSSNRHSKAGRGRIVAPESYSPSVYRVIEDSAIDSAEEVTSLLWKLFQPTSVVDVGCGTGAWLASFRRYGVQTVLGIDSYDHDKVPNRLSRAEYRKADLTQPLPFDQKFDLALCLEVAEHLPPSAAPTLVENLTKLSNVIVFSAAIPGQMGFGHVNERWPSFWCRLFDRAGFRTVDRLRFAVWNNPRVEFWYSQNLLVFVRRNPAPHSAGVEKLLALPVPDGLPLVHPRIYSYRSRGEIGGFTRRSAAVMERFPRMWSFLSRRRRRRIQTSWPDDRG